MAQKRWTFTLSPSLSSWPNRMQSSPPERPGIPAASMAHDIHLVSIAETPLDIGRSAEDVFAYLADFPRHAEWEQTTHSVDPTDPGALAPGVRLRARGDFGPRWDKLPFGEQGGKTECTIEVTAVDRPRRLAWRTAAVEPP